MDKYKTMIEWLRGCDLMDTVLGFQTVDAQDGAIRVLTIGSDAEGRRTYIDGSVLRRFDFTIEIYKSLSDVPVGSDLSLSNQNIDQILDVQGLIDWIDDQRSSGNVPNFGNGYTVESVTSLNDQPNMAWLDAVNYDPPLAKYTVTIRVEYIDFTRAIK